MTRVLKVFGFICSNFPDLRFGVLLSSLEGQLSSSEHFKHGYTLICLFDEHKK